MKKYCKQADNAFVTKSGFEKLVTLSLKEFVTDTNKKQFAASITDRLFSLYDVYVPPCRSSAQPVWRSLSTPRQVDTHP